MGQFLKRSRGRTSGADRAHGGGVMGLVPADRGDVVRQAAAEVGRELGLKPTWLNQDSRVYQHVMAAGWQSRCVEVGVFGKLDMRAVGRFDLIVAKVMGAPHRVQDREDLRYLKPTAGELGKVVKHLDRLEAVRAEARVIGAPMSVKLPHDAPLLNVPAGLIRILDRDLAAAGIPKRDERGRTVDVHAMRHTFATHLSKGGVPPRTAQAALRHSKLELTMNTYTDPRLLDVAGALDVLPTLPLDGKHTERTKATGTDARTIVPLLVPTAGNVSTHGTTADKIAVKGHGSSNDGSVQPDTVSEPLTRHVQKRVIGLEPTTFTLAT